MTFNLWVQSNRAPMDFLLGHMLDVMFVLLNVIRSEDLEVREYMSTMPGGYSYKIVSLYLFLYNIQFLSVSRSLFTYKKATLLYKNICSESL